MPQAESADHCCASKHFAVLQSAASQSQHVVNVLTSGDPVNAGDVEKVEADERNNNDTGLLAKGGPTAKVQASAPGCSCVECYSACFAERTDL